MSNAIARRVVFINPIFSSALDSALMGHQTLCPERPEDLKAGTKAAVSVIKFWSNVLGLRAHQIRRDYYILVIFRQICYVT